MRPSQMGRLQTEDFLLDELAPFVGVPPRQGRTAGSDTARRRRAGRGPRLDGASRLWMVVLPECQQGLGAGGPKGRASGVHRVSDSPFVRHGASADVADIQDLYGHTDPQTTMIYAPPQLQKHAAAIERLQRTDRVPAPESARDSIGRNRWQYRGVSINQ